jgi:hypothetical protein
MNKWIREYVKEGKKSRMNWWAGCTTSQVSTAAELQNIVCDLLGYETVHYFLTLSASSLQCRMVGWLNWKLFGNRRPWLNRSIYIGIYLDGRRKTMKRLSVPPMSRVRFELSTSRISLRDLPLRQPHPWHSVVWYTVTNVSEEQPASTFKQKKTT